MFLWLSRFENNDNQQHNKIVNIAEHTTILAPYILFIQNFVVFLQIVMNYEINLSNYVELGPEMFMIEDSNTSATRAIHK